MVENLERGQARWLLGLIMFLLAFCTFLAGWSKYESMTNLSQIVSIKETLPKEYVQKERYKCDMDRLEKLAGKIDSKLDHLIQRQIRDDHH